MAKKLPPGKRYPLRVLQRRYEMLRVITLVLPLAAFGLWWIAPSIEWLAWADPFLLGIIFLSLMAWVVSLLAPALCYVQCQRDHLYISSLVYRFKVPYGRMTAVTTVNFGELYPLSRQKELEQMMLAPLFKEAKARELSAVGVAMKKMDPTSAVVKFWLGKYVLLPREPGFLLVTRNWEALGRDIDKYRQAWLDRRAKKQQQGVSPASRILGL